MMPEASQAAGEWTAEELRATAKSHFGLGADRDLPGPIRMLAAIHAVLRRRSAREEAKLDPTQPAIFLLRPSPPEGIGDGLRTVPMLDNGLTQLAGRVWFVNEVVLRGRYFEASVADDEELIELVGSFGCEADPAVLYDPRTTPPTLRFYPSGMGELDDCIVLNATGDAPVTIDSIFSVIDRLHNDVLITPDGQDAAGIVWASSGTGIPASDAEARVQLHVRLALKFAFLGCRIRKEQPGTPGRLDLLVESSDASTQAVTIHAVLELKVLRAYWNSGSAVSDLENQTAIRKGVKQAAKYRDDRSARESALCCFDMRRADASDVCFDHVRKLAKSLGVRLGYWHLFWSAEDWRNASIADPA